MPDQKLNAIEEILAHQDQQIHDLSEMLIRQSGEIAALKKHVLRLQDKMGAMADDAGGSDKPLSASEQAAQDKPPHY